MAQTDQETQRKILQLTRNYLHQILTFATTVRIQKFILHKNETNFREFEEEAAYLENHESIKGVGVVATRENITSMVPTHEQDFFYDNIPLESYELGAHINSFPLQAASASYLFTLLEIFGNEVATLLNPSSIGRNKAWHEDVKGSTDLNDKVQVRKAQKAFARHLTAAVDKVPELAAYRIIKLKHARNKFAHKGGQAVQFDEFLHDTLAIICHNFPCYGREPYLSLSLGGS